MKFSSEICGNLPGWSPGATARIGTAAQFVDGEPVQEHLLEDPSTRTGRNGMVRETSLMQNWAVNLARDSPPPVTRYSHFHGNPLSI
jgi:hypothetical protein